MTEFNIGTSKVFGDIEDAKSGSIGVTFWGNGLFKFDGGIEDKINLLKSASNFVKILTGEKIPVKYARNGDESFTDGKTITISSKIVPENMDSTIGLALHEASHCAITDFDLLRNFIAKINVPEQYHKHIGFIKGLWNWIEDRRIDNWAYNQAPGYEKYYDALYDRYFFTEKVSESIVKNKDFLSKETLKNYEFFIINSMHPIVNMTELKGLPAIKDIIDLERVGRWRSSKDCLNVAYKIYDEIIKYVTDDDLDENLSGDIHVSDIDDILNEQRRFLSGNLNKKTITDKEARDIDINLGDTDISEKHFKKGNIEVICINSVDETTIKSGIYEIFRSASISAQIPWISEGISLGKMLGSKLKLRDEEKVLKTVNQKSGLINKRALYSASYDNSRLFYTLKEENYKDIAVHISIDMSGSMSFGKKWHNTLIALVALIKATSMIKGIRTQVSFRYGSLSGLQSEAIVICFYDSLKDNINKVKLLQYIAPIGGTPEGICFEAMVDNIIKPLLVRDTLFINISDGEPMMFGMTKKQGIEITRDMIIKFKKMGINILSYFISENQPSDKTIENFKIMYGNEAEFIDVNNIMLLTKTINAKFLKLGK